MNIKEIHAKAGSLSNSFGYILILCCWYLINNLYSTIQPKLSGATVITLLNWGFQILFAPIIFSIVYGGISERQKKQDLFDGITFINNIKNHFWRLMAAKLLYFLAFFIVSILAVIASGYQKPSILENKVYLGVNTVLFALIDLFWVSSIIEERKIFKGLIRSFKTVIFHPYALGIGVLWGLISFADMIMFDLSTEPISLPVNVLRSAVLAGCKVLAIMYALAIYKIIWAKPSDEAQAETTLDQTPATTPGEKLINTSFSFAFVSFIPLFHLVSLVLGAMALIKEKRFVLRAAIACCIGGFFTILYLFLVTALFLEKPAASMAPGYQFLAEVNPELVPYVALLENGQTQEFQQKVDTQFTNNSDRSWAVDSALALAMLQENDIESALADFQIAAGKDPERSEFYFYYGLALLDNDQEANAVDQFKNALRYEPDLQIAEWYVNLIESAYKPSTVVSAVMYVIILLILFTFHEYGHAFAAWKLGDDTAKNMGRLTLNPIPHLDMFGSIILPAILLFQGSESVFGWAKPVPVNPANFKNPQKDHMRVSFAGPAVNLMVAMVCIILLAAILLLVRILWPDTLALNISAPYSSVSLVGPPIAQWIVAIIVVLKQLFYTSLVLGCFNLIPVPPLDGSWIFAGLLPQRLREILEKVRPFSYILFLLLVITPVLDYFLVIPIGLAWGALHILALAMGFA